MAAMRCHYEVLGVVRTATGEEIKKSYRKLALKLHPDKNPDNIQECTRLFAEIQNAYDVLSDSQERAWYDAHREAILRGGVGLGGSHEGLDLVPYFSASCYDGFGDDEEGFYGVYGKVFATIRAEDIVHLDSVGETDYPPLGKSTSDYLPTVKGFYAFWQSYSTPKPFAWADKYDAPNRQIRRLIEKDNQKARDAEKKKYNDEVRQLVAFVRKRDKRVKEWSEKQKKIEEVLQLLGSVLGYRDRSESELELERAVPEERDRVAAEKRKQAQRERVSAMHTYQAQAWTEVNHDLVEDHIDDEFGTDSSLEISDEEWDSDEEVPDLYCVACERRFKSQKALDNHEMSKKHQERLARLRLEMEADDAQADESDEDEEKSDVEHESGSDNDGDGLLDAGEAVADNEPEEQQVQESDASSGSADDMTHTKGKDRRRGKKKKKALVNRTGMEEIEAVVAATASLSVSAPEEQNADVSESVTPATPSSQSPKPAKLKGKKAKEARKAARLERGDDDAEDVGPGSRNDETVCQICKAEFPTRNKLFQHVNKTGHAALKTVISSRVHDDSDEAAPKRGKGKRK